MIRQIYTGKVKSLEKINDYIYNMWIKVDMPLMFNAGQFMSLFVSDRDSRAFSIASSPRYSIDNNEIRFIIGPHPGGYTERFLTPLKINDSIKFRGPFGIFTVDRTIMDPSNFDINIDLVFIATSTGIAPFLSMIEYLADIGIKNKVILYFGLRHHSEIIFEDEFELLKTRLNFEYYYCISQPEEGKTESNTTHHGYVTDLVVQKQKDQDFCYICGSTKVVSSISSVLRGENYKNIFFENYG